MIVDAVLGIVIGLVRGLLRLFPDFEMDLTTPSSTVFGLLGRLDGYFPVSTLVTVVGIWVAIQVAGLGWRAAVWVWERFPGKAS